MILLTLPVLYIISVGPIGWAWQKFDLYRFQGLTTAAAVIYLPLENLYKSDSLAGRIYKRYTEFWLAPHPT